MDNFLYPLKLYVYNIEVDSVREVTLTPNSSWGGEGCLGCNIGYGYLHRIPVSIDRSKPFVSDFVQNERASINQKPGVVNQQTSVQIGFDQINNDVLNPDPKQQFNLSEAPQHYDPPNEQPTPLIYSSSDTEE